MNSSAFNIEVETINETDWSELLPLFSDSSIHQSWSMGRVKSGEMNLSHLLIKKNQEVVAMAQVAIRKLRGVTGGLATVYMGPLWRRRDRTADYVVLEKAIEALKNEYAAKRGLLLRIWPSGLDDTQEITISLLHKYGFKHNGMIPKYRTLLLDLSPSLEELRRNLASNWRNHLKSAEKSNLILKEGASDDLYGIFLNMLHEMVSRKRFASNVDYDHYRLIQSDLPELLKMRIFVCDCNGEAVSASVITAIGETGTYLLGATADSGLRSNGSNLVHWRVISWLKERGCRWYDLGGIDPNGNPGVYHFKRGIAGKSGREVTHIGQFYLATNPVSYLLSICIRWLSSIREKLGTR